MSEFGGRDEAVAVLVKHLERLPDFLLRVRVLHLACHHGEELGKVDGAVAVRVDLVDHVLEFGLGRVLTEGAHDGAEFASGDLAIAVLCRVSHEGQSLAVEVGDWGVVVD